MIMKKLLLPTIILGIVSMSCQKQKALESVFTYDCTDTISYNQFIAVEIINKSCNLSGCHADGAGGKTWTGYQEVSDNADLIYSVISHEPGAKQMPLGGDKLSDSLIAQFKCWIDQGKLDN